jgi:hypothetical protein
VFRRFGLGRMHLNQIQLYNQKRFPVRRGLVAGDWDGGGRCVQQHHCPTAIPFPPTHCSFHSPVPAVIVLEMWVVWGLREIRMMSTFNGTDS